MGIKPLILLEVSYPSISGGYRREYETLRHGRKHGINYIILTDTSSYRNALSIFPDFAKTLGNYKTYMRENKEDQTLIPIVEQLASYKAAYLSALDISRIARREDADIIVSQSENPLSILKCYLAGKLCSKPWTVILQGFPIAGNLDYELVQKSSWRAFLEAPRMKQIRRKYVSLIQMLLTLKILQKTVTLSASKSIPSELKLFNRNLDVWDIDPPCGIDLHMIDETKPAEQSFDAFYFGRFIPSKGMYDLPLIWKKVTKENPTAILGIAGPAIDREHVKRFFNLVQRHSLTKNIIYLGPLPHAEVIRFVKSSKVVIYPSREDSFSMVVLESLACGVPVVAFRSHALVVHYSDFTGVRLFPIHAFDEMASEILTLIRNEVYRQHVLTNANYLVRRFSWDSVAQAELTAFEKVIQKFNRT